MNRMACNTASVTASQLILSHCDTDPLHLIPSSNSAADQMSSSTHSIDDILGNGKHDHISECENEKGKAKYISMMLLKCGHDEA